MAIKLYYSTDKYVFVFYNDSQHSRAKEFNPDVEWWIKIN